MKKKSKEPFVPRERQETIRKEIITLLKEQTPSAKEISGYIRISEKEVCEHLEHIRKSIERNKLKLIVEPATCRKCGFVFKNRKRIKKPGRCPACRGESIEDPLFSIG